MRTNKYQQCSSYSFLVDFSRVTVLLFLPRVPTRVDSRSLSGTGRFTRSGDTASRKVLYQILQAFGKLIEILTCQDRIGTECTNKEGWKAKVEIHAAVMLRPRALISKGPVALEVHVKGGGGLAGVISRPER
jgi:hypothetical protein